MKNSQKGFIVPALVAIIALLVIGGSVYVFKQSKSQQVSQEPTKDNQTVSTPTKQVTVFSTNEYVGWNTYTNTTYHYSIKYPSNWYITTQYSNQDFTPRGPAPHDYIGGDTSISNYSPAQIDQYHKTNGDLEYPSDYTVVSWRFWKTPTQSNLDSTPVDVDSFKKENVVVNGVPGIKTTTLGQRGVGGATKPNSVGINFKLNGELVNIGYGFDANNTSSAQIADQIINSFILETNNKGEGTVNVSAKSIAPTISVSGMKQYTDSDFGFSFWYPASWTVQNGSIQDAYVGGTVQKTLVVAPSGSNVSRGDAITINEFHSPTREITIARDLCSPMSGSFVAEHRYYFDVNTHTWMVEVPTYTGQSERDGSQYSVPASTKAADVSNNTMGGLHMLAAGCSGSVIPLSAKNFVVLSFYSRNVGPNYIELAKTITATDPSVATPVSSEEQKQVITKAGVLLGGIGTKVGEWYVTVEHVYDWVGNIVASANPSTFRLVPYSDGTAGAPYATDGVYVYSAWSARAPVLTGADPATFIAIRQQYQIPYSPNSGLYGQSFTAYDTQFAKDKSNVWYGSRLIPGADPITFVVTGDTLVKNANGGYTLAHDVGHIYGTDAKGKFTADGVAVWQ